MGKLRIYDSDGKLQEFEPVDTAVVIKKDGSVAFTGNQPMGSHKLTGLFAGTQSGDSLAKGSPVLEGSDVARIDNVNAIGGIPLIHRIAVPGGANNNIDVALTHKERVLDAWIVLKAAGTAGSKITIKYFDGVNPYPISESVDIAAGVDKALFRIASIDDAYHEIVANKALRVTYQSTGGDCPAAEVYVLAIRVS